MSNYRRVYIKGGTYFFTVVTHQRKPVFENPQNINHLRDAFSYTKQRLPFSLKAIVILPDHLHCIWRLPELDDDYSRRWNMIKGFVSKKIKPDNEKPIWQARFWEHLIRNEEDFNKHLDYIHFNPVKHGYVSSPLQATNSTIHKYISKGWYPENWGESVPTSIDGMDLD